MRILVLGASGGCGSWVTRLAANKNHVVTAIVRPDTQYQPPPGVVVQRANAIDPNDLSSAVEGQDAVISCIGPQRINPRNPWSALRPPPHCAELTARAVVSALHNSSVRRFAAISAAGVADSFDMVNRVMRSLIRRSTIGSMYADLEAMEQVFVESNLDWVAVRPVTLVNAAPSTRTKLLTRIGILSIVGRGDVAQWLLKVVEAPEPPRIARL